MKLRQFLPTLIAALILPFAAHSSVLVGFETSEGFVAGDTGKTVGQWVLPATGIISTEQAYSGSQSLKLTGNGITQYNPSTTILGANYNALTFDLLTTGFIANSQIGLWQIIYGGDKSESRIELQLFFGATAADSIRAEYRATFTGAGSPSSYTTVFLDNLNGTDLLSWTEINFGIDFSEEKFRITAGGETVAAYEDLATGINQSRISRAFFRGNSSVSSYYDNVTLSHATVIPEPGTFSLLLLPAIYLAVRRRRS